jgi:polysaccharide pyruvyl transferase WcaK-like protein/SAM-dependent methyltransferase
LRRIVLLGVFGRQNLGNECTLQAFLSRCRRAFPDAAVECICTAPEATSAAYDIPAFPLTAGRSAAGLRLKPPILRIARSVFIYIPMEVRHWVRAFQMLARADMLVVPGTGILTDAYQTSLGWPYDIFKWSLIARLCKCKLLFVSVGGGPVDQPLSRWFIKAALSLADYRSYRDESTKKFLIDIDFPAQDDRVYPDLAFHTSLVAPGRPDRRAGSRPVVAIGLMMYPGKPGTDEPDKAVYVTYLEKLAVFVSWLLTHGYDVRFVVGDLTYDGHAQRDFRDLLNTYGSACAEGRIIDEPVSSVENLLSQLRASDIVVATRFHNVVMAMLLDKPVISISFHHKCASLMDAMGLAAYSHDIHRMDVDRLIDQFHDLENHAEKVKALILRKTEEFRDALEEQYAIIFDRLYAGGRTAEPLLDRVLHLRLCGKSPVGGFLRVAQWVWSRLPGSTIRWPPTRFIGHLFHALVCRWRDRRQYFGTLFLRNRPQLELIRRLSYQAERASVLRITVLGCSNGAEVYSIVATLRAARPTLKLCMHAVDISREIVDIAEAGEYSCHSPELVGAPIFESMTETDMQLMFDRVGDRVRIRPCISEGIIWSVADAGDPELAEALGPQDIVVANNFMCHMKAGAAERCLRRVARILRPGGYLLVSGIDLDVRTRVAADLGWTPVNDLLEDIHEGDAAVRQDWPWQVWGLEPFDRHRDDWMIRYAAAFQLGQGSGAAREAVSLHLT